MCSMEIPTTLAPPVMALGAITGGKQSFTLFSLELKSLLTPPSPAAITQEIQHRGRR